MESGVGKGGDGRRWTASGCNGLAKANAGSAADGGVGEGDGGKGGA